MRLPSFRIVSDCDRKVFDVWQANPSVYAGLLEDPSGKGRQFLFSAAGRHYPLSATADAEAWFAQWRVLAKQRYAHAYAGDALCYVVYCAYEMAQHIEVLPQPKTQQLPYDAYLFLPDASMSFDPERRLVLLSSIDGEQGLNVLQELLFDTSAASLPALQEQTEIEGTSAQDYAQAVEQVKAYIHAGDVFQANIARFWSQPFAEQQLGSLYQRLRQVNPAPFSLFWQMPHKQQFFSLLSASPERLFRVSANAEVETRPIAGTRRRGIDAEDLALQKELLLSEKERAEHLMLVDLERNDMGRVCRPGSVHVDEMMSIEHYATVQHIVSNIRGVLREGTDLVDVFKACFPGGTITGCPKVRCMELIHQLEPQARGPYTGGVGYMTWDGAFDMNILIRSFWHYDATLSWAAGAGIVADSQAEHETIETEHKAEGLLRALR